MATGYSTNLELALPVQGELSGTWGNTVNNGITEYLDAAIAGSQIISGSQTAVTLSNTNGDASNTNIVQAGSGSTGTAQYQIIRCTGNPAGLLTITISDSLTAGYSKTFIIINATSTSQSVKIVGSGPTTGITVLSGAKSFVAWNGSDFVEIASSTADGVTTFSAGTTGLTPNTATSGAVTLAGTLAIANGGTGTSSTTFVNAATNVTGTLPVANGGTNLSSGTSGGVLAYTATGVLASSAALAANNVVVGGGAGAAPSSTNILKLAAAVTSGSYIQALGYADTVVALGNTGVAKNIDLTSGNVFTATLTGNCTFTVRFPVATGASSFTLILTNDATPGRSVTYAGGTFKLPGGSVTRTTTANATDIWFFFTPDGGTTYFGSIPMANLS
jgi:hypothetical protein